MHPYPSPLFFIPCGVDGDCINSIDGSDYMYLPRNRNSYRLGQPMGYMMPTYEDCQARYETLLNDIQDLESDTFTEHWLYRAKSLKREHGCWEHFNRLIRTVVKMYPNHIGLMGIAGFTRNRSSVLTKEKLTPWEKIETMEAAYDGFI